MDINYCVPEKVYEYLNHIRKETKDTWDELQESTKEAIAYGDLSENATFDVLKNQSAIISKVLILNNDFFDKCEIGTIASIREEEPHLYKKFTLELSNKSNPSEKPFIKEGVLIPNFELDDSKFIPIGSQLGQYLRSYDETGSKFITCHNQSIFIRVLKAKTVPLKEDWSYDI